MNLKQIMGLDNALPGSPGIVARHFDANQFGTIPDERLIRLPEVMGLTGLKKSTVYLKVSQGDFPSPVKIGLRASAWKFSEVNKWIVGRVPVMATLAKWGA